jgi:Fur family ferric uptake transcriptional regulator
MASTAPSADWDTRLREAGIRPTRQRVAVLSTLAERDDATAQQLHQLLRARGSAAGLATVYRTLALLAEAGVIDTLTHHPGEACYRVCGDGHHHHLVCTSCHRVVEIADCVPEEWLERLAGEHGFALTGHAVELSGVCSDCRQASSR